MVVKLLIENTFDSAYSGIQHVEVFSTSEVSAYSRFFNE